MTKLRIVHLYPHEMNIYGDRGNVITLVRRLSWRGFGVEVDEVGINDSYDLHKADIIFGGGGQDRGQSVITQDLQKRKANFHEAVEDGIAALMICGMYQLL